MLNAVKHLVFGVTRLFAEFTLSAVKVLRVTSWVTKVCRIAQSLYHRVFHDPNARREGLQNRAIILDNHCNAQPHIALIMK